MRVNSKWLFTLSFILAAGTFSMWTARAANEGLVPCQSVDLRSVSAGFKCATATGAVFERVSRDGFGEAWKLPDGNIWSDVVGSTTQYDGVDVCRTLDVLIPSRLDFQHGEDSGFREVLPNLNGRWHWSSSVDPGELYWAWAFNGGDGSATNLARNHEFMAIRCISR